jgi:TPR repeat protein
LDELGDTSWEEVKKYAELGNAKYQTLWAIYSAVRRFSAKKDSLYRRFGAKRDLAASLRWARRAADQGYAPGQFYLGLSYNDPCVLGVEPNYAEAAEWYCKAADQGFAPAGFNLGVMYDMGEGVRQSYIEAAGWYRKAADQGFCAAQFNLAIKYEKGEGVPQDSTEAAKWYSKAAEEEHSSAQFNLGLKYARGQGVGQDYVQAYMWMAVAVPRASVDDKKKYAAARDSLAAKMSPAQIFEAQRRELVWETERREASIAKGKRNRRFGRCNKCGECKELAVAGWTCASCGEALDRRWAGSAATDWFITRPAGEGRVCDLALLNTSYTEMKDYSWAANDPQSRRLGFFRYRQATPEEVAQLKSQWGPWCFNSPARVVRPATPEEVAAKIQHDREWQIACDTENIIGDVCEKLGIQTDKNLVPIGDRQQIKQAAVEIVERLQQIGLLEELAKMKRENSDALDAIEHDQVLKMAGLW